MGPVLVSTADASAWTGRPIGTIYRWASEGRIGRHGRKYDLRELPAATEAGPGHTPPLPAGLKAA